MIMLDRSVLSVYVAARASVYVHIEGRVEEPNPHIALYLVIGVGIGY